MWEIKRKSGNLRKAEETKKCYKLKLQDCSKTSYKLERCHLYGQILVALLFEVRLNVTSKEIYFWKCDISFNKESNHSCNTKQRETTYTSHFVWAVSPARWASFCCDAQFYTEQLTGEREKLLVKRYWAGTLPKKSSSTRLTKKMTKDWAILRIKHWLKYTGGEQGWWLCTRAV